MSVHQLDRPARPVPPPNEWRCTMCGAAWDEGEQSTCVCKRLLAAIALVLTVAFVCGTLIVIATKEEAPALLDQPEARTPLRMEQE